jgi:transcriptional regulator with XRE-family HTH domain
MPCQVLRLISKLWQYAGMAGKEPSIGPTSRAVALNVKRWRDARNMSYAQLSDKLATEAQWSINPVGIRRIETGERRVTPDDLTALAVALRISPITLLMPGLPDADDPVEMVEVTGVDAKVPAAQLWKWLVGEMPLTSGRALAFFEDAQPAWETAQWIKETPDGR